MPLSYADRLSALRAALSEAGLSGFIVPHDDEFLNEYPPACGERLRWLTGFSGSSGVAIVLLDRAVVLTDGRYTIQVRRETDPALYETGDFTRTPVASWLAENARKDMVIGYDPRLHTPSEIARMHDRLDALDIVLKPVAVNPLDTVWRERPAPPSSPAELFPESIAGRSAEEKRRLVQDHLLSKSACGVLIAAPDSVAWLLNVRGLDIPCNPFLLSRAILYAEDGSVDWFIAPERVGEAVRAHLGPSVRVRPPEALDGALTELAHEAIKEDRPILLDFAATPVFYRQFLHSLNAPHRDDRDPCVGVRGRKTPSERGAVIRAHEEDGLALIRFFAWLEGQDLAQSSLDEVGVDERLEAFRRLSPAFREPSFDTIAGFGANGAVIHYRATPETAQRLSEGGILLLDSGGQYGRDLVWGTTDVTRAVAVGRVRDAEAIRHYTLVLKGHVAISRLRFPAGTTGAHIDSLARMALWQHGLDFAHRTGHGVGCYGSVHEESACIGARDHVALEPGMVLSNEPGYYREGAYGIRIENLMLVEDSGLSLPQGKALLEFRPLTLCPYDRALIDAALLTHEERAWIDAYHARVRETLLPRLDRPEDEAARAWLERMTALIA